MNQQTLDRLVGHFRDVATVDISGLQNGEIMLPRHETMVRHHRSSTPHLSSSEGSGSAEITNTGCEKPQILQVNQDKIRELGRVMEERRYSKSTIDTYLSMLKQFFTHHSSKCWDELSKDDVVAFNHAVFILRNRSFSTQNQAINAIKLFYAVHGGLMGKKDRPVPLSAGVYALLDQYIKLYAPHVYVFEGVNGGKYSYSSSRQLFQRAVRSSGLRRHITLHTLRHSYATHLLQSGTDIRYIQEILGHNDPKTTMIYTRVTMRDLREIKSPFDDMGL